MSTTTTLTKKQQATWETIQTLSKQYGRQPTLEEIAIGLQINSKSTVHEHVKALIKAGVLLPSKGKKAYEMPPEPVEVTLPILGRIAAGKPIQVVEDERTVSPNDLFVRDNRYALLVRGDSMIDIGILDGDYVVIQRQHHAHNGEVVSVLVEGFETTLKRIYFLGDGQVELRPENRSMPSMFYPAESIEVQGKMVGLFRKWS
ncbi:MAG: transcriptional repressor LexA [Pseudomonadota bacterium]|jgi:repressor LexA